MRYRYEIVCYNRVYFVYGTKEIFGKITIRYLLARWRYGIRLARRIINYKKNLIKFYTTNLLHVSIWRQFFPEMFRDFY